jgi:AcrR family transcriptional regulator
MPPPTDLENPPMQAVQDPSDAPVPSPTGRASTRGEARVTAATRQRYLSLAAELVGRDMVSEPAFAHVMSHIRLTDVAAHLGVPRSRLYRLWEVQHDFWADLSTFVTVGSHPWPHALPSGPMPPDDPEALLESLRSWFAAVQVHARVAPNLVAQIGLTAYPKFPPLAERLATWHAFHRRELARRLGAILSAVGRAPVEPLTLDDLAAAVWMLVFGVTVLGRTDPAANTLRIHLPSERGTEHQPWSLLAYAVRAVALELSRPASSTAWVVDGADPSARPRLPEWTPAQLAALQAGAELFTRSIDPDLTTDARPRPVLGHITFARLARTAGVSRRQLHHVWSSQASFSRDLVEFLRHHDHLEYFDQFEASVTDALTTGEAPPPTVSTITLEVTERLFTARLVSPPAPSLPATLALQPHLGDPLVRDQNRKALARFAGFQQRHIDGLAALFGIELRPGLSTEHLNLLIMAASNGSVILHHLDPAAIRLDIPFREGRYSLLSIACQALVDHSVARPDPSA